MQLLLFVGLLVFYGTEQSLLESSSVNSCWLAVSVTVFHPYHRFPSSTSVYSLILWEETMFSSPHLNITFIDATKQITHGFVNNVYIYVVLSRAQLKKRPRSQNVAPLNVDRCQ